LALLQVFGTPEIYQKRVHLKIEQMKRIIISIVFTLFIGQIFAQASFYPGKIRIIVNDHELILTDSSNSNNVAFEQFITNYGLTPSMFSRPLSFAETPELQKLYEINTSMSENVLYDALDSLNKSEMNSLFYSIEKCPLPQLLAEPGDWFYQSPSDHLWYLKKIQAEQAWDITKGSPSVKVAIIDSKLDVINHLHPDLVGKISPEYNFFTGQPFGPTSTGHGTSVATILAAETVEIGQQANGNMASIGWNTQIMYQELPGSGAMGADIALYASTVLDADIISISFSQGCNEVTSWTLMEKEILDNGTSIFRAAGNGSQNCNGGRVYPFSGLEDSRVIVVSSTGKDDRHQNTFLTCDPNNFANSHYAEVDLCAPGYEIMAGKETANGSNAYPYYHCWGGTSQSTPIVAGTASLMYDVNPCLTPSLTQDILKNTTDPIVDAANFPGGVGTGRLNAFKAVQAAQNSYSSSLDLYIKDRPEDFGNEVNPYTWTWDIDESPDIWVRNQNDGLTNQVNQEPDYQSSSPVYVYVRVRNKSCATSLGTEEVDLHWTKASSMTSWPQNWDGSDPNTGDLIGTEQIGVLEPGEETILVFTWNILNPYIHQNWASCLMARIVNSNTDNITIYPNEAHLDVYHNNNIALRNVTVTDIAPGMAEPIGNIGDIYYPNGKYVFIGNADTVENNFNFTFSTREGKHLSSYAEIKLIFDDQGWNIFENYFTDNDSYEIVQPKVVHIKNDSAVLSNVYFPENVRVPVFVGFSFYADAEQIEESFMFDLRQYSSNDSILFGGEHFLVNKAIRSPFDADAGADKTINYGENVTISAVEIAESAIYNWYDPEGNKVFTGKDLIVSPEITEKYKLEVVATSDGSIDVDEVEVEVKRNFITNIFPNPADNFVNLDLILDGQAASSYVMIVNQTGTSFSNYILGSNQSQITINLDNYQFGLYTVVLVCDGIATDAKQIIIN
jgi:hypothetical protein